MDKIEVAGTKVTEAALSRLAAIVGSSDDAIIGKDLNSTITDWNPGAESVFGYTASEMVGTSVMRLIPADRQEEENFILGKIRRGEKVERFETFRQTKDGRMIHVSATVSPINDSSGNVIGALTIARDITRPQQHEREIARITRLYAALSQVNQAIVWTPTRDELFAKICRVLIEHGGFRMAWIGWRDPATQQIVPVAAWGEGQDYIRSIQVYADDRPEGRGPTGLAFRSGRPYLCNDVRQNPVTAPWRPEMIRRGFNASAAFPIRLKNEVCATLTVYSDERWFFQDKEIALLAEAAGDISFALDNFAEKEARRKVEEVAANERAFSETMIESMPGILYIYDEHERFLRWNKNFEVVSGYSAEEITRMHPLDFFSGEDKPSLRERIAEVFERGESSVEASFVSKDGRARPYFFTGRRVVFHGQTCLVGMGVDISERKRAEIRLTESERKYRELVELANSIILRWDTEGKVTFLNEFGQRFFGFAAHEILGRSVMGTIVPATESSGRDLQDLMERICADPRSFEQNINENVRRNGERVWISWTNRIVRDGQGQVREILSVGTDITERRRAEQALRVLNQTLELEVAKRTSDVQSALIRAEAADRIKSAFLATMSHELRTPLNSIIGFTGIVLQGLAGPLTAEQSKQLGMVRNSSRHLLELINDVLDLSKIEAGQLEVRAEPFLLGESLERVVASVKPLAEKKKLALSLVAPPDLGEVTSDRRRVEQILLNLISNAVKFTEHGGVTVRAEKVAAYQTAPEAPPRPAVRLRVTDTGIGIKSEDLAILFQPFRQIESGLNREHDGTGLGLVICRRLATLLGGQISAASEWAKGSEFAFVIPVGPEHTP